MSQSARLAQSAGGMTCSNCMGRCMLTRGILNSATSAGGAGAGSLFGGVASFCGHINAGGFMSKDQPEQDTLSIDWDDAFEIDWDDAFDLTKLDFPDFDPFADSP